MSDVQRLMRGPQLRTLVTDGGDAPFVMIEPLRFYPATSITGNAPVHIYTREVRA